MRLRIIHQLSLLLIVAVLLAVAAVGGVVAWNLKAGFSDYLRNRDGQQLERFARLVALHAATEPSLDSLRNGRGGMRTLVDQFLRMENLPVPSDYAPRPGQRDGPPGRPAGGPDGGPPGGPWGGPDDGRPGGPPPFRPDARPEGGPDGRPREQRGGAPSARNDARPGRPPDGPSDGPPPEGAALQDSPSATGTAQSRQPQRPPAGEGGVQRRLQIVDLQRNMIAGPPQPPGTPMLEEPILVNQVPVAYARMPVPPELQSVDARFLRRQYLGLATAAAGTLLLALLAAWLTARHFSRPLRELRDATRRLAEGQPHVPVREAGAQEMAQLIADVNRMAASLQTLESARRSWVAQISHELRTPLAVLRGELEAVEDGAREPTPELMKNLRDEVLQLVRLVNDLHTLSMADLDALPCEYVDGDATGAIAWAVRRFESRATKARITLELVQDDGPVRARWDFGRVEQLIANLLENSLRYTDAPGRIRVRSSRSGPMMELHVEDSPPGVSPQDMALLFEPLHRADTARQRRRHGIDAGGSGLGLSIARAIVLMHGGKISAGPSPLGGLAIHVSLALEPEKAR